MKISLKTLPKMKNLNKNGFTMIEVVAAFAILSIALLTLAAMFGTAARINGNSHQVKEYGNATATSAEIGSPVSDVNIIQTNKTISIMINGKTYNIAGTYKKYTSDKRNTVHSAVFIPD